MFSHAEPADAAALVVYAEALLGWSLAHGTPTLLKQRPGSPPPPRARSASIPPSATARPTASSARSTASCPRRAQNLRDALERFEAAVAVAPAYLPTRLAYAERVRHAHERRRRSTSSCSRRSSPPIPRRCPRPPRRTPTRSAHRQEAARPPQVTRLGATRLGTTSCIWHDYMLPNVERLAGRVDDVELLALRRRLTICPRRRRRRPPRRARTRARPQLHGAHAARRQPRLRRRVAPPRTASTRCAAPSPGAPRSPRSPTPCTSTSATASTTPRHRRPPPPSTPGATAPAARSRRSSPTSRRARSRSSASTTTSPSSLPSCARSTSRSALDVGHLLRDGRSHPRRRRRAAAACAHPAAPRHAPRRPRPQVADLRPARRNRLAATNAARASVRRRADARGLRCGRPRVLARRRALAVALSALNEKSSATRTPRPAA